nr:uncharacterized mitochondrial protein AtMg00810-like [Tanacetum cinerariifolium]
MVYIKLLELGIKLWLPIFWKMVFIEVKQKKDGIFISQDKYVVEILRKFRLTEGKSASTPIDTKKPLLKDPNGKDLDDIHTELDSSKANGSWANDNCLMRLQALVNKNKVVITEATIRDALRLDDPEGIDCLPNKEIFTELARLGYEKPSTKLTFNKAFFSSQWKFLIYTILQSRSAKCTSWNEFSSAIASAVQDDVDDAAAQGVDTAIQGDDGRMIDALMVDKEEEKQIEEAMGTGDDQVKGRQAEIYKIDMDHALKVLSMQEDEPEVQEVVDVVTIAKMITEVITTASESVNAASTTIAATEPQVPASTITTAPERFVDKGKRIMVEEPKPMKKKHKVKIDEEYARKLHEEINKDIEWNKDIDWNVTIDHVKKKYKEDPFVQNIKLDYFKGMSYDDIRLIFEAKFNSNIEVLLKIKEQLEDEENRAIHSINETLAQKAAKRRKLNQEVEDLK